MSRFRMSFILLFGLVLGACNSLLDTDYFKTSECTEKKTRCAGDTTVEKCSGGVWQVQEDCDLKVCVDGACVETPCLAVDKIDILFAIDNSRSMADKQQILALAIPDLVKSLVNPQCVDANGAPAPMQPEGPLDGCPAGTSREFQPVLDIHIGIVSSSLGGHGSDSCPDVEMASKECMPEPNYSTNDKGRLIDRRDPCSGQTVATYQGKHFLAWDPTNQYGGETVLDNGTMGLVPALREMVLGTGQIGCGFESQLESVYRFLADPNPFDTLALAAGQVIPVGTDAQVLQERADFLRPDSLLGIIMLTDENDCSIKDFGHFYLVAQRYFGGMAFRLPRARQECAKDPNDPCCKSCGEALGLCPEDPTCKDPNGGPGPALLSDIEDSQQLRCWDQKRRFGMDFLYPTDRYVQAFMLPEIADRDGNIVPNPIFSAPNSDDPNPKIRSRQHIFFAGIAGVPWQDIARDPTDLKQGFKNPSEMAEGIDPNDTASPTAWDVILGEPAAYVKPLDPLMIETFEKRSGKNPITGDELADSTENPLGNPINGHEWSIPDRNDLQYACVFPLLPGMKRDCTDNYQPSCDCVDITNDNPLCVADPNNMDKLTLQVRAKAYPGTRPLTVVRDLGFQGIVASICPAQLTNQDEADFGYRPAIGAILERLRTCLQK